MLEILEKQRAFYKTNRTIDVNFRLCQLKNLKGEIFRQKQNIFEAFKKDMNKFEFDVISTELGLVVEEINYMLKHLKRLARPKKVGTTIVNFPSKGYKYYEPFGNTLVVAPWNYPFQLTIIPLIGAIAGGNTVVVKPSRNTPNITKVIVDILSVFPEEYIYVVTKEEEINALFDQRFDFIFYTGSPNVGKMLMEKQGKYLTPMILELGGKSPCIISDSANLELAAKRATWGKFLNAGQTCVAPDYFLVHSSLKEQFIEKVRFYISKFFYEGDDLSPYFVKVINQKAADHLATLIDKNKVIVGGNFNKQVLEPTVIDNVTFEDAIMQEEIFGPIMPIIEYDDFDKAIEKINTMEKPLAFYYFGNNKEEIKKVTNNCPFGGGCINDVIMHLTEPKLPFGGVGNSGMGNYHGAKTFYAFTHEKSVLHKSYKTDINLKYPPATKKKMKLISFIFKIK